MVADFPQIIQTSFHSDACFGGQQFAESRLSTFNPARKYRFATNKRAHEHMRVGKTSAFAGQLSDQAVPRRTGGGESGATSREWAVVVRNEGGVPALRHQSPGNLWRFWRWLAPTAPENSTGDYFREVIKSKIRNGRVSDLREIDPVSVTFVLNLEMG